MRQVSEIQKLSSGSEILLTITLELKMISQNISRIIVGNVLINISSSNIFSTTLMLGGYHQKYQAAFGHCEL